MSFHRKTLSSPYAELVIFGAVLFLTSVLVEIYINSWPYMGFSPGIMAASSFMMIFGTAYLYFDKSKVTRFPNRFSTFPLCCMALGLAISIFPLFYYVSQPSILLTGPTIFAYGLTIAGTQLFLYYRFKMRNLLISAMILIVTGALLFYFAGLYNGTRYVSLGYLPIVSGVYLLFVPTIMKNYRHWKRLGYFDDPAM